MKVRCSNCGGKLKVPDAHAGKRGRCPKCKHTLTIPGATGEKAAAGPTMRQAATAGPRAVIDVQLLDVSYEAASQAASADEPESAERAYERLQALHGGPLIKEPQEIPQRRLPWVIDIFLYPVNKAGLSILLISVGVPFLLRVALRFFRIFSAAFPPALILWVLFIMLHWGGLLIFLLYVNWYVCECIRDSANGGLRAVETTALTPGLWELIAQAFKVVAAVAVCLLPAMIYLGYSRSADRTFDILYAAGGFLFPMALLAMVMFDEFRALSPLLLLGSILSTFLWYCGLVVFSYLLLLLIPLSGALLRKAWVFGYVTMFLDFYLLLVLAHLLGRFYWKNEERLNWAA